MHQKKAYKNTPPQHNHGYSLKDAHYILNLKHEEGEKSDRYRAIVHFVYELGMPITTAEHTYATIVQPALAHSHKHVHALEQSEKEFVQMLEQKVASATGKTIHPGSLAFLVIKGGKQITNGGNQP